MVAPSRQTVTLGLLAAPWIAEVMPLPEPSLPPFSVIASDVELQPSAYEIEPAAGGMESTTTVKVAVEVRFAPFRIVTVCAPLGAPAAPVKL